MQLKIPSNMKILNLFFFILFLLSAALQYNDPDPYVWIPIYLYGGVLCFLAARGKFFPGLYLLGIAGFLAYASYFFFTKDGVLDWYRDHHAESLVQSMKATKPWIEATREFLGLLILVAALAINYFYSVRLRRGGVAVNKKTTV